MRAKALFFNGEKTMITSILPYLQTFLAVGNLCIMLWALRTFLAKPRVTLEEQIKSLEKTIDTLELKIAEVEVSLRQGNDRFREQEDTNEVLIRSLFALIEFEVHYCETEHKPISKNLERAKDDLHDFLAGRKNN